MHDAEFDFQKAMPVLPPHSSSLYNDDHHHARVHGPDSDEEPVTTSLPPTSPPLFPPDPPHIPASHPPDAAHEIRRLVSDVNWMYGILHDGENAGFVAAHEDFGENAESVLNLLVSTERDYRVLNGGNDRMIQGPPRMPGAGQSRSLESLVQRNFSHLRTIQNFQHACNVFLDVAEAMLYETSHIETWAMVCLIQDLQDSIKFITRLVLESLQRLYRLEGFHSIDTWEVTLQCTS